METESTEAVPSEGLGLADCLGIAGYRARQLTHVALSHLPGPGCTLAILACVPPRDPRRPAPVRSSRWSATVLCSPAWHATLLRPTRALPLPEELEHAFSPRAVPLLRRTPRGGGAFSPRSWPTRSSRSTAARPQRACNAAPEQTGPVDHGMPTPTKAGPPGARPRLRVWNWPLAAARHPLCCTRRSPPLGSPLLDPAEQVHCSLLLPSAPGHPALGDPM